MPHVDSLHIGLGGPEFEGQRPAPVIPDPDLTGALCQRFRKELLDFPLHFLGTVRVPGFPLIRIQWIALFKTAGIILLRSGDIDPDVFSLLLNGVETADEMKQIYQHVPPLWPHWQSVLDAPRPVAVHGHYRLSRMRDSGVTTVLSTFCNSYFTQFGTSGE